MEEGAFACHRALIRALKTITRAQRLATEAELPTVAEDLSSIWEELMRVTRSLHHADAPRADSPSRCA
jgi:hypothetical protein